MYIPHLIIFHRLPFISLSNVNVKPSTTPFPSTSINNNIASHTMSNDVSPEAMQTRIQQARREAENLKDRIKRKKDDLADASRKCGRVRNDRKA